MAVPRHKPIKPGTLEDHASTSCRYGARICNPQQPGKSRQPANCNGSDSGWLLRIANGKWVYEPETTANKSRNNPFYDWPLKGKAVTTIMGGKIVWHEQMEPARV